MIGAGYIAVELAGVLNALGSDTSIFCRKDGVLRTFDVSGYSVYQGRARYTLHLHFLISGYCALYT